MHSHLSTCLAALLLLPTLHAAPPPELTLLQQAYDKAQSTQVTTPHDTAVAELNKKFTAGLDRAIAEAQKAGKLPDIIAIEADKKRLTDSLPIPDDDDSTPAALKSLRGIYRQQLAKIEETRATAQLPLVTAMVGKLKDLETTLTKGGRLDEAKEVLAYREGLASGTMPASTPAASKEPAAPEPEKTGQKHTGNDRKAAEWVLANWSELRLFANDKLIKTASDLPKGKFALTGFAIDGRFYTGKAPLSRALLSENLGGLGELREITLGNFPDLKDDDLAFLGTLTGLEELSLSKLECSDGVLPHLKSLKKLHKLSLNEIRGINGTGFAQLEGLADLRALTHWKGGMTDEGVVAVTKLSKLMSLDFQSSKGVTNACIPHLRAMKNLVTLHLSETGITPEGFEGRPMPNIVSLAANSLANLPLSEIAPKMAVIFPNVETLMHTYYATTPEDLSSLAHFKKLKNLVNSGSIKDEALPGLLELRELESYRVYNNGISPATWEALAKLKKLKHVYYGSTPPNEAAMTAFRTERKEVKMEK